MLSHMMKNNNEVLMILETKLHSSFSQSQFIIEGRAPPLRYDESSHGGGILLFVRKDIPARKNQINTTSLKSFEGIFVELNLSKKKNYAVLITHTKSTSHIIFTFLGKHWISKR